VGVVLYEMLTGRRPFDERTSAATAAAILTREPTALSEAAPLIAPELARVVAKALRKDPAQRYQTSKDLFVDLRALREVPGSGVSPSVPEPATAAPRRPMRAVPAVLIVGALAAGAWYAWHQSRIRTATQQVLQAEALTNERQYFEAFDLALAAERVLPRDPALARLMPILAMTVTVTTTPDDARVYAQRFAPDPEGRFPDRILLGRTPLRDVRIARGEYVIQVEKEGFARFERTVSGSFSFVGNFRVAQPPLVIDHRLVPAEDVPAGMVPVSGTEYRLASWERPTDRQVHLDDFFIDRYEVSNREFRAFITAGGYVKREYWKVPFIKDGRTLSWDEAMKLLVDQSGLPGPRSWSGQNIPEGRAEHPVADVTWYEAAAYAAFRGKALPTIFQWERAARFGPVAAPVNFMPWGAFQPGAALDHRANFDNQGTRPVTSYPFGISPFGAYNMAGNVREWTGNETSEGLIATGGAWGDPTYVFAQFSRVPAFFSSPKLGFRCALTTSGARGSQGAEHIEINHEIPVYSASTAAEFEKWRAVYEYPVTPLDARVEDVQDTPDWRRERITFTGARGERGIAYLYLPRHFTPPLQVINFVPAADVDRGFRPLAASMEDRLAAFIKTGRAAFGVVLTGYQERLRPGGGDRPDIRTVEYLEEMVSRITDLRRGLDYLATRADVDASKIAFFGPSAGGQLGLVLAAVETRYRAVALVGSGLPASSRTIIDRANPINFAPHIKPPKLMVHGKYDEDTPLRTAGMPLYDVLPQPKRIVLYEGGHVPPDGLAFSVISPFLDEILGAVKRQ
jgi:formylglycine-generating enzyme required for sulfatase activity